MTFHINAACWNHYDQNALLDLMEAHPFLFPDFRRPAVPVVMEYDDVARAGEPYVDDFGCKWETAMDGIVGSVHEHPLADMSRYAAYKFPDPEKSTGLRSIDWAEFEAELSDLGRQNMAYAQPITSSYDQKSRDMMTAGGYTYYSLHDSSSMKTRWFPSPNFCYGSRCPVPQSFGGSCLPSKLISFLVL